MAQDLTVFAKGRLQWLDGDIPRLHLFFDSEMSGRSGGLAEGHPGWFHADAGKGDVSRTGRDGNDEAVDLLRDHDAVGNLVGPGDVIQHAEVALQHNRVAGLAFATRETVDRKLADGDGIGMMRDRFTFAGDVMFGQRDLANETPSFADIELEGEMLLVVRVVRWRAFDDSRGLQRHSGETR